MLHVGCVGFHIPKARYFAKFSFVEIADTFLTPLRAATLKKLRKGAPPECIYAMRALQTVTHPSGSPPHARLLPKPTPQAAIKMGHLQDSAEVRAGWTETLKAAEALNAQLIIVETPPSFTPTTANREAVLRFFKGVERAGRTLVWEPRGLWERKAALKLATDAGVVLAEDPLGDPADELEPSGAEVVVLRVRGLGNARISERQLEKVLLACAGAREAYVLFETPMATKDAERFLALKDELLEAAESVDEDDEDEDEDEDDGEGEDEDDDEDEDEDEDEDDEDEDDEDEDEDEDE